MTIQSGQIRQSVTRFESVVSVLTEDQNELKFFFELIIMQKRSMNCHHISWLCSAQSACEKTHKDWCKTVTHQLACSRSKLRSHALNWSTTISSSFRSTFRNVLHCGCKQWEKSYSKSNIIGFDANLHQAEVKFMLTCWPWLTTKKCKPRVTS